MLQPTADAASCLIAHSATACTDVTGFGLLGHLLEMLRASQADATLDPDAVPALPGALALLRSGIASSLHADNQAATAALDPGGTTPERVALLIDPQTAGGLLAGVPLEHVAACLEVLRRDGYAAAEIGVVERCQGEAPRVRLVPGHRSVSRREPVPTS
jgi:selenide, water dikinase